MTDKVSKFEAQYGPIADQMALRYGLDPKLFRNQIRQESGFNPQARSGVGAVGIGQFMPGTAKQYGYTPEQLIQNPQAALEIAAKHMRKLSDTYGDQRLALAAYNGGGGSINFVKEKLGKKTITYEDWLKFNKDRRAQLGNHPTAWHGQTLDYVEKITKGQANPQPQKPVASAKPSDKKTPIVQPPIQQTPQIQSPIPANFDYFEALMKQNQGNPNKPEVPQSASQTPLLPSGQPDPRQQRLEQVAMAYQNLLKQKEQQTLANQAMVKQQEEQKKSQQQMLDKQKALQQMAQMFEQPQHKVVLEPIENTQDMVQMQQLPLDAFTRTYGGFSQ